MRFLRDCSSSWAAITSPPSLTHDHPVFIRLIHSIMRFFVVWKFLWQDESMQANVRGLDRSVDRC